MYIGCDVGRHFDATALVGLSATLDAYAVERICVMRGTNFRSQAKFISEIAQGNKLYLDCTGLGTGLFDLLQPLCVVKPVLIRSGDKVKFHRSGYAVGKQFLMSLIGLALPKLTVNEQIPNGIKLLFRRQLGDMRVIPGKTAKFGAKHAGTGDDLVLALSLALLGAQFDG